MTQCLTDEPVLRNFRQQVRTQLITSYFPVHSMVAGLNLLSLSLI